MEQSFKFWFEKVVRPFQELPFFVSWGVWIHMKKIIFENIHVSALRVATGALGVINEWILHIETKKSRILKAPKFNYAARWNFFMVQVKEKIIGVVGV